MPRKKNQILTGVEIGTSNVKVVMGEILPDDAISIVAASEVPALKMMKGEVLDADVVQEQLARALTLAEQGCGQDITDLFLAVSAGHIKTVNSIGSTMIQSPDRRIQEDDIIKAARNARAYNFPPDRRIIHSFDRFYRIDDHREVINPLGLLGSKLEADVHIVYGYHNRLETNCSIVADVLGYPAVDIAFSIIAAGLAAFGSEETEKGALLIDMGAGVTEYIVFTGLGCFHSGQITVGCEHLVNDLSLGLRLPLPKCRKILQDLGQFGAAVMNPDGRTRLMAVEVLGKSQRHIPISTVERIIDLRLRELFEHIMEDLRAHRALERIGMGAYLCGGGARIAGVEKLAQQILRMPVHRARPRLMSGKAEILDAPEYMTPLGLIRWGKRILEIGAPVKLPLWQQCRRDAGWAWQQLKQSFRW